MARRQDHFLLHGGLDLVTSPLAVPNGRLLAVKNYEPVEGGYGRLAGYERFDGRPSPSDAVYSILGFDAARAVAAKGDTLTGETSGATAEVIVDPVVTVDDAELAIADWDSGDVDDTSSQTKAPADAYKFASSLAQADVLSQKALLNGTLFTTLCEIDSLRLDYRMDVDGNTPYIRYLDDADPTAVGDGTLVSLTGFSWDGQTIYGTVTLTDLPKGRRFWFGSSLSVTSTLRRLRIRATGNACIVSEGHYVIAEISGTFQDDENLQVSGATKGVADGTPQSEGAGDLAKHESYLSAAAENRRADIAAVPGSGPVRGVWAYDGVVYAFRDNDADPATKCVMHKSTASGWTAVALGKKIGFDAGTDKPASGTTIAGQTSGATASLVATLLASGSWTGDDAAGTFYLKTVSGTFQNDERLRIPADTELGTGYAKVANTDTPAAGKVARDSSVATKWRLRPKSGDTLATFAAIVAGTLVHVRIDASNYIALDVSAVSDDGTYLILDLTAAATTAGTVADDAAVSVRLKASPVAVADGVAGDIELDPGGRFEFRNHNFLGQSDTRYMYGVDGKNPAFEWDGTEYRPIVTGLLAGKEKPKHLAIQSEHLLLAYPGGSLQNSATGKPLDWTVTAGAAEIATGQEINGLVEGVGAGNTAVLGANRIQILYGTDKETWDLRDQSGEEAGAVEWSGQMMGEPVYMDNRGVRSIRSTPAYSNFNIGTMTYPVQPWLERQRAGGAVPVSSMRVRARDMYRVFFDTKIGLSIYFGRGKPECSLVELLHAVRCSCSFEADDGVERVFFGSDDGWVFEMEKGRSFDGEQIEWFARLPFNHVNSPSHDIRFHKADLQVDVEAKASLRVGASFDYGDNPEAFLGEAAALYGGGAMWNEVEWSDFYWDSPLETVGQFHFSGIGSNVSLLIYGLSALELPHVLTGVTLHYSNRKAAAMSNDYYSEEFSGFEHGRASAKQTEDSLKGVQAGFAKLPRERELKENRVNYATATYTSNQVFAVTLPYAIETYTDGLFFAVKMPVANGGSATINVNGVGAKPIKDIQGNTLQANQWAASAIVGLRYTSEGTGHFILQGGGIRGSRGAAGLPGFPFGFDTTTAMADPGAGKFRFNHATPSSVTAIAVDDTDADGSDIAAYIATFDDYGNSTARGHLIVRRPGGADALVFLVTALTDNSGWTQLTVTHVSGSTLPNTTDTYGVSFQPIGVPGATTPVATTSVKGKVELATNDEIDGETGTGSIVPTISGLYRAITRKSITAFSSLTFAASLTWNVGTNPNATITLTGNVTGLTLSGDKDGGVYTLLIKQDTTGSRTFAFPSGWKWAGGSADSIASGASDETLLTIRKVGTDIVAAPLLKDVA